MNQATILKLCFGTILIMVALSQCDKCKYFKSKNDCLSGVHNTLCRWNKEDELCEHLSCKDFTLEQCYQETDTGNKCYFDVKRGCSLMLGGCTSLQVDCNTTLWCKATYNGAWCIDEIDYTDKYCFNKLNNDTCVGIDNVDETAACFWQNEKCTPTSRDSSCINFPEQYHCEMMWGCSFRDGTCIKNDCSYLAQEDCTFIRTGQFAYTPCAWNRNTSICTDIPKSMLSETTCMPYTGNTFTWSKPTNSCVPCQGSASAAILTFGLIVISLL